MRELALSAFAFLKQNKRGHTRLFSITNIHHQRRERPGETEPSKRAGAFNHSDRVGCRQGDLARCFGVVLHHQLERDGLLVSDSWMRIPGLVSLV